MSQKAEDPAITQLRWVLDHVVRTLGELTHQVGKLAGRQEAFENEMVNRVKEIEGRERDRRSSHPSKLEIIKALPWREIIGVTVLIAAGLYGHAGGAEWVEWVLGKHR